MTEPVQPQLAAESFSCPHCGAFAHQMWFRGLLANYQKGQSPSVVVYGPDLRNLVKGGRREDEQERQERWTAFLDRLEKNHLTYQIVEVPERSQTEMVNFCFSKCYSCDGFCVWVEDQLVYPAMDSTIVAHAEMPANVKEDFDEAVSIVEKSPRGAAALLRLCVQKIVIELGGTGDNLNNDIGELVRKSIIDKRIQQALDLVRVVGNNAVHPGQIDLNDDRSIAMNLFNLVNVIVEATISAPKHIREMYETVIPEGVRQQIEKRDSEG